MRVRSWPSRPFKLRNVGVVGWCLLAAALLLPSRQDGAPVDGAAEQSRQAAAEPATHGPSQAAQARAIGAYGRLPLGFESNQGQTDSRVRFLSRGSGYLLFLTPDEAVLALESERSQQPGRTSKLPQIGLEIGKPKPPAVLRMQLVGSNAQAGMVGTDRLPGKSNYFLGNDPSRWYTNVPNYRKVAEHAVYPGIDLIYYGTQSQLEYDFVVAPGADPCAIRLAVRGAKKLRIDSQGNLIASVGKGDVSFQRPVAYQEDSHGARQPVAARYSIKGGRNVEFKLGKHDPSRSLVIDPTLAYSTYVGGSLIDGANGIGVAPDDSVFITGETYSVDYPTVDALFPKGPGGEVAFVSKVSPDGSALLYSTYLGCNPTVGNAIAVDSLGEAYVTGTTMCPGFPTTEGTPQSWCADDNKCGATWNPPGATVFNGFVTKLNVEGTALLWSTFVGDYSMCAGRGIAVDEAQNAYVTGDVGANIMETVPLTPPETPPPLFCHSNGFQITLGGSGGNPYGGVGTDAFLLKIDADGSQYLYCTYLGGSDEDLGFGVAVDTAANAYVTGLTYSSDFPTGGGALQTKYAGAGDAFLTKVNTNANGAASFVFSTFLGGSGLDQGNGVAVDTSGNAYVAGLTTSRASSLLFTSPSGAYQADCHLDSLNVCEGDAFVAKVALSGAPSLTYFTYLGGSLADSANGIALDSSDNAYVAGSTASTDFPIVGAVPQTTYGGGNADAFVTELNATGSALVYSTYLGGSATDIANGIAVDGGNPASAYAAGQTCSFDFPLANPLQPDYGGNCDAFVSKVSILEGIALHPTGLSFPTQSLGTSSQSQTVTLTNGDLSQTITSITITGADPGDFALSNTCPISPSTLAPGAQCTITVAFTPQAQGIRKASVEFIDSAPGSPQYVTLTGSTSPVGISPSELVFGNQQVSVASSPQPLTVTNNGSTAVTIASVTASGAFSQTSDCTNAPLQPTANCVVNVVFTPIAPGPNVGAVAITDTAPGSPQVVMLTGTGAAIPAVTLSATSLTFPGQSVGTASAIQTLTITNTGSTLLTITSIVTTGDFSQTSNCPTSLAVGANCAISVIFTPTAAGSRTGTLTITDSAANSPQIVTLGGGGSDFTISVTPTSASVVAGNSVSYTMTVTPSFGFNAKVNLSCTGTVPEGSCSVSPSAVTPDGTNPISATVTVTTTVRSMLPPRSGPNLTLPRLTTRVGPAWFMWLLLLLTLVASQVMARRRGALLRLALVMGLVLLWVACSTGGSQVDVPQGTPAGNYVLTLTGTTSIAPVSHSTTANLTVQ